MQIIQYIVCCVMLLLMPPISWIYVLIYWVYNGCKIPSFSLEDIAICECWDGGNTSMEEIAVLRQMLDDFRLKNQADD